MGNLRGAYSGRRTGAILMLARCVNPGEETNQFIVFAYVFFNIGICVVFLRFVVVGQFCVVAQQQDSVALRVVV